MAVRHDEGFFSAKDNLRLFWVSDTPDSPKAWVGVVHGYNDHLGRYRGPMGHLNASGFATMAFDYRGHGQSDGRRAHCDSFDDFVGDMERFYAKLRQAAGGKKVFLLAHSNGGLIAVNWILKSPPEGLAGWVLSSPYLGLALTPPKLKVLGGKILGKILPWAPIPQQFTSKDLTRDEAFQRETDRDPLYSHVVTPRYFEEVTKANARAVQAGGKITWPTLVFAGSDDPIISTPTTREFFPTIAARDKTYKEYPGMRHECMNEVGKEAVWMDVAGWISAHL